MNWYYEQNGQRQGPVPESELPKLLASGAINQRTLVWREGLENWTALADAWTPPTPGAAAASTSDEVAGSATPQPGWIQCTATGRWFPPSQIVTIGGKPYSAAAKPQVLQGALESGVLPSGAEADRTGPAWEQRAELGVLKSGWETIKAVLGNPGETFSGMKREGGLGTPLYYLVLWGTIGSVVGLAYQFLLQLLAPMFGSDPAQSKVIEAMGVTGGMMIGYVIAMPIFMLASAFIGAGILHLSLMICGGAKQAFETTLRTYCYAQGSASMLQIIPGCGALVSGIWALVATCIGLARTHEITTGRAVCAVLLPTVVCCVGVMFVVGAVMGAAMAAQGAH
jgi:hypothetical protein